MCLYEWILSSRTDAMDICIGCNFSGSLRYILFKGGPENPKRDDRFTQGWLVPFSKLSVLYMESSFDCPDQTNYIRTQLSMASAIYRAEIINVGHVLTWAPVHTWRVGSKLISLYLASPTREKPRSTHLNPWPVQGPH